VFPVVTHSMMRYHNMIYRIKSLFKKHIIFIGIVLYVLISIAILILNPTTRKGPLGFGSPAQMKTFQAVDGTFSLLYPSNWTVFDTPHGSRGDDEIVAVIIVAGHQLSNVTIARRTFVTNDINDVLKWGQDRAKSHPEYESLSLESLKINKSIYFVQKYQWLSYGLFSDVIHCEDEYFLVDQSGYDLSFCSKQSDWSMLEKVFHEMRISFFVQKAVKIW
jgi:hypothetical protein